MNLTRRQPPAAAATEERPTRREQADELRARAATVREELAAEERALRERQEADEAAQLDAAAHSLDLEQDRIDRAAELVQAADQAVETAEQLSRRIEDLDAQLFDALARAARFEQQIRVELADRRRALADRGAGAAERGDADALLEVERDTGLLPAIEQRLQEQADAAVERAVEANGEAARLESLADDRRREARLLRAHAAADPLAPFHDPDFQPPEFLEKAGRRHGDYRAGRDAALQVLRQLPDLHERDVAAVQAAFDEARRATIRRLRTERATGLIDPLRPLVERVRDVAMAEASPWDGSLDWVDTRDGIRTPRILGQARSELARAITTYRRSSQRELGTVASGLPRCTALAAASGFRFATEVVSAAAEALDEVARERSIIAAASDADPG